MKRWTLVVVVALVGCGTNDPDGSAGASAPSTEEQGAVSVPMQEVLLQVMPGGKCTLHPNPDDPSVTLRADADDAGLVRVNFSEESLRQGLPLGTMDCADTGGARMRPSLDTGPLMASQPALRQAEARIVASWKDRPALTGDPLSYTPAELVQRGFGMRPDPQAKPEAYAQWLEAASRPAKLAPGTLKEAPDVFHGGYSSAWAAVEVRHPGFVFDVVSGTWTVPHIEASLQAAMQGGSDSSLWVGLDGDGSSDVLQDGTDQNQACAVHGSWTCTATYSAWVEWFPQHTQYLSNFPVAPGDPILAQTWVGDSAGNINVNGGRGWFYMYNSRTGITYFNSIAKPSNVNFVGNVAEAVMEKFRSVDALAKFGTASIQGFFTWTATDGNTTNHDFNTDTTDLVHLTWDGRVTGDLLATSQKTNASTATFFWQHWR